MRQNKKFKSFKTAVIMQFCGFILATCLLFSFFNFMFLYTLEDAFLLKMVTNEADYLEQSYKQTGQWPSPRYDNMRLHFAKSDLPELIIMGLEQEPRATEFFGEDGKHYHLYRIANHGDTFLLSEVSDQLEVRPMRTVYLVFLSILASLLTALACWLAWKLSRKLIMPLSNLAELVHQTKPQQLPAEFAHQYPNNEIGQLALTLEHAMQQIRDFVDREQQFTRDASHELRTPVAIVKSAITLLQQNPKLDHNAQRQLKTISRACLNMEQSVNTLLSLARKDTSEPTEQIQLLAEVEASIVNCHHLLENKEVAVEVEIPSQLSIAANLGAVRILLANLISNAFQYTFEGEIRVMWQGGQLVISDSGPGIEVDIEEKLFEPMVKGRNSQGFGIGLSIVKRLCEHHGYQITIDHSHPGTTVKIKF